MPRWWNKWLGMGMCLLILALSMQVKAQVSDEELIAKQELSESRFNGRQVSFLQFSNSSALVKYNPVSLSMSSLMFFYQKVVSPQISAECMYSPSCSNFSKALIAEFGIFKGVFLSADRLMRCNRLGALDVHPLSIDPTTNLVLESPEKFRVKKKKSRATADHDHDHDHDHSDPNHTH